MTAEQQERSLGRKRSYVPNTRVSRLRLRRLRRGRLEELHRKSLIAYWWAPFLVCVVPLAGIFAVAFPSFRPQSSVHKALPPPGIYWVSVSAERVQELVKAETVRRRARALGDEDVGISLATTLPEPAPRERQTVVSDLSAISFAVTSETPSIDFLPPSYREQVVLLESDTLQVRMDEALSSCAFQVRLPSLESGASDEPLIFRVRLNAHGATEEVLRLSPNGKETPWMRAVRQAVSAGRGEGAAEGILSVCRKIEVRK